VKFIAALLLSLSLLLPPGFAIEVYADVPNARSMALGENGTIFVSNRRASSVYAIVRGDEGYAQIIRMNPDGSDRETFVEGIRNSVGFTWHPDSGELWFTDNGRDMMGDDIPPGELNHAPVQELGPHVAPLGLKFYTGDSFPAEYQGQIFIAEHGSWNRSKKIGYRVSLVRLGNGKPASYEVFAEG